MPIPFMNSLNRLFRRQSKLVVHVDAKLLSLICDTVESLEDMTAMLDYLRVKEMKRNPNLDPMACPHYTAILWAEDLIERWRKITD